MTRYQITRLGLINVFEYGNQTFEFAGGHLLLRGHNGAGKSKALELSLPFVLDGDTTSQRLDPFGGRSRPMKWNLLMDGRHEVRQGYVWLEFHRADTGDWITLAVGLRAARDTDRTDTWFVIIRGARIGVDVHLINPATQAPHGKRGLRDRLGDCAEVYDHAGEYRSRVNELLFGFQTVERYETMLSLQRQLRRPHLSRDLEPRQLSDILSQSLPEIDHELVGDLGRKLDAIEQLRAELAALRGVHGDFGAFVDTYRDYARAVTQTRITAVAERHSALVAARREHAERQAALAAAMARLAELDEQIGAVTGEQATLRGEHDELLASPAMRAANELRSLADTAAASERAHTQITGRLADNRAGLTDARDAHERAAHAHRGALARRHDALGELDAHARAARLDLHDALVEQFAAAADPSAAAREMRAHAKDRRRQIAAQRNLRSAHAAAEQVARIRGEAAEKADAALTTVAGRKAAADETLSEQREALSAAVGAWLEGLCELPVSEPIAAALGELIAGLGDDAGALARPLAEPHAAAARRLADENARAGVERDQLIAEQQRLTAERRRWLDEQDPAPEPPATRTADRDRRPGAPLWQLVDFDARLADAQRAGLEGALEASGLLDAWVTPDGALLDIDGDTFALGGRSTAGLERWLHPVSEGAGVRPAVVEGVLAAIRGVETGAGHHASQACVALDGSFRLGPLAGRHAKPRAQFIGVDARRADRQRRIDQLTAELAGLDEHLAAVCERLDAMAARRARLDVELNTLPADDAVRAAFRAAVELARQLNGARETARDARDAADRADADAQTAALACRQHAHDHHLPAPRQPPELDAIDEAVDDYVAALPVLIAAHRAAADELARQERAAETLSRLNARETELTAAAGDAERRLAEAAGALKAARERDGGDAQRTVARVDELKAGLHAAQERLEALGAERDTANRDEATLASTLVGVAAAVAESGERERSAVAAFKALAPHDLLTLALADGAPTTGELDAWDAGRVIALGRSHRDKLRTQAGVDTLTNRVDGDFMDLRGRLDGSVGVEPVKVLGDGLILVSALRAGGVEPVRVVLDALAEEIAAHQRLLSEEEERTFEEFLFNGLAGHLRERIAGAHRLVSDTNDAISACRTSSGITVDLVWDSVTDGDPALTRALKLLRTAPQALNDEQRADLVRFFRDRVEAGRVATEDGTVTDHLIGALDYRRWHAFKVMQHRDGKREQLTRARHQAGSGGEKSTALHLPLFAAASALMASAQPHAPRMIMLDEAFAGIDSTMRGQLLGLICQFDLDFMLTSHELWCCEPELDQLSIYHLDRQMGLPGVGAVQFLWDGHTRREIAEAA